MRGVGFAAGLAWRLARTRDPQHRWRQVLVAVGAFVATLVLLTGLSAVAAAHRADARQAERRPLAVADTSVGLKTALRGPVWHGRQIPVLWIEPSHGESPIPPGLSRLPRPGMVAISQGLRDDGFPSDPIGFTIDRAGTGPDGTIGRDGSSTSTEYLIYARPPAGRSLGQGGVLMSIVGFGDKAPHGRTFALSFETVQPHPPALRELVTSGFLFVLPAFALAITTARAMSPTIARRSRGLRRLGVRLAVVRLIVALETAIIALPGAALALLVHAAVSRRTDGIPGAGVRYWSGDLALPIVLAVLAALCVSLVQLSASLPAMAPNPSPRNHGRGEPWIGSVLALPSGALALGVLLVIVSRAQSSVRLLVVGLLAAVLGLGSSVRQLTSAVARALGGSQKAATWLAAARLRYGPLGLSRPATLVAILVLVTLAWTGVQARALHATLEQGPTTTGFTLSWRGPAVDDLARLRSSVPGERIWPMDLENRVLVPDCAAARELAGVSCASNRLSTKDAEALRSRLGYEVRIEPSAQQLVISEGSTRVFVVGRSSSPGELEAVANGFLPGVSLESALTLGPPQQLRWVVPGGVAATTLALLSFLLAFGNRLLSLIGTDRGLLRAGLSQTDVRDVQRIEAFLPMLVAVILGGVVGGAFLWAGTGLELTRGVWMVGLLEMACVLLLALAVSTGVRRLQRRWLLPENRRRDGQFR